MQIKLIRITHAAVLIFALLTCNTSFSQSYNLLWDKTYGGFSRDWNCAITVDNDGSLYLTGDSQSDISGDKTSPLCQNQSNSDLWMMKLDGSGNILWQRSMGGEGDERSPHLFHLNNPAKEMLLTCFSTSDTACDKTELNRDTVPLLSSDYWICLLDSTGIIIWDKTLGGDNYDDNVTASVLASNEILISGESNSPVGYDKSVPNYSISNDFWTLLLDQAGNKIWDKVYGGDGTEMLGSMIVENDGSFLLAGSTNSTISGDVSVAGQGLNDFWMIKLDALGNKLWDKRYGGTGPDICKYAVKTNDNGYILCGYTVSPQSGDVSEPPKGIQDFWVLKTDSIGNKIWDKRFGGSDGSFGSWVSKAAGGGYWVGGYSDSDNSLDVSEASYGGSDYWFLKIDESGNKIWDKRLGGSGNEFFLGLTLTADSSMYAFGYSDSGSSVVKTAPDKGWLDYWVVKFSYTDTVTSINDYPAQVFDYVISPNPTTGNFLIKIFTDHQSDVWVSITDLAGRATYKNFQSLDMGETIIGIDAGEFAPGVYVLRIHSNDGDDRYEKFIIH